MAFGSRSSASGHQLHQPKPGMTCPFTRKFWGLGLYTPPKQPGGTAQRETGTVHTMERLSVHGSPAGSAPWAGAELAGAELAGAELARAGLVTASVFSCGTAGGRGARV